MENKYWIFVFVTLLQGCASLSQNLIQNVPEDYKLTADKDEGLIVVSTRFLADNCVAVSGSSAWFAVYKEGSTRGDILWMKSPFLNIDPADPTRQLFIRKYSAGKYSLGRFGYVRPTERGAEFKLDIPFVVLPGQVHYLGEITVIAQTCTDLDVKVVNQKGRDVDLLSKRIKTVPAHLVKDQIVFYDPLKKERIR